MNLNLQKLAPYAKACVAVLGFLLLLAKALSDGTVSNDEVEQLLIAAGVVIGIHQVPNKTSSK